LEIKITIKILQGLNLKTHDSVGIENILKNVFLTSLGS